MAAPIDASIPDLLRLLSLPVFGWAAWRDVQTRRVPNRTWYPLAALAVGLLVWEGWQAWTGTPYQTRAFALRAAISLGFVAPLVIAFWWFRAFGGADAKAFLVVAALFPTYPTYEILGWVLPYQRTLVGVFSLTILTNTVLVGALYPLGVFARNAAAGRFSPVMFVGKPVSTGAVPTEHGRLLETPAGVTRNGVDLDALRMYLRWRGLSLAELRERPDRFRAPASLPADPNPPGDGAVGPAAGERDASRSPAAERSGDEEAHADGDGGRAEGDRANAETGDARAEPGDPRADGGPGRETLPADAVPDDDPWGARTFLDALDHGAYGATPEALRDGLEVLAREDEVWVSPGIPFVVPLFVGTAAALTYGDLLFGALAWLGLA